MRSPNTAYLPAIDHLRALAALLILAYHGLHGISYEAVFHEPFSYAKGWPVANLFTALLVEGHLAVSLFMVLSGFIFTRAALGHELRTGAFLKNRLLRTAPLVVLLLAMGLLAAPRNLSVAGIANLLLLGPLTEVLDGREVARQFTGGVYTSMFWAVTVEWHFYLLFPFLLRVLDQPDGRGIGALLGFWLAVLVVRDSVVLLDGSPHKFGYTSILGRIDQFVAGMLLAAWLRRRPELAAPARSWAARWLTLGAGLLVASGYALLLNRGIGLPPDAPVRILWCTVEALIGAFFIVCYLRFCGTRAYRPLARVGEMSYSIYLLHLIVAAMLIRQAWYFDTGVLGLDAHGSAFLTVVLVMLPVTLVAAWLSYQFVEKPFLEQRVRYLEPLPSAPKASET